MPPDISVVVPLRDEEPNVLPLHAELSAVMERFGRTYELIFVEDGSRDDTYARLVEVHARDPHHVRVIRFSANFGQTAAFAAGFAYAGGRLIVTLDGDLQNDPADIPRMVALAADHDIVCGWRKDRQDAYLTRYLPSVAANWLIGLVAGIRLHDNGCSMKVFHARVVKPLRLSPGMHRYLPALAARIGPRVVEVIVHHRPRKFGRSKYGLSRTFGVLRDIVRLRRRIRQAADPGTPPVRIYDVAGILELAPAASRAAVDS